jgi:hypothetical protein
MTVLHAAPRVPKDLEPMILDWMSAGRPSQAGIEWSRELWIADFPEHREMLASLPCPLNRQEVRITCAWALLVTRRALKELCSP